MKYISIITVILLCIILGAMWFYYFRAESIDLTKPACPELEIESDIQRFLANGSNIQPNITIPEHADSHIRQLYLAYIIDGSFDAFIEQEQKRMSQHLNDTILPDEIDNKFQFGNMEKSGEHIPLEKLAALEVLYKPKWDFTKKRYCEDLNAYYNNCAEYNKNMRRCEYGWITLGCITIIYLLILLVRTLRKKAAR